MERPCALCEVRPRRPHDIVCEGCGKRLDTEIEELTEDEQSRLVAASIDGYGNR